MDEPTQKNLGGRPTLCTPEVTDLYCQALRDGLSFRSAAAEADIWDTTADDWVARGKKGEEPFATFYREREKAIAEWERVRHGAMDEAGPQWAREAWRLERRLPDEYGKRERHDVNLGGQRDNPVSVKHDHGDAVSALRELVAARRACGTDPGATGRSPEGPDSGSGGGTDPEDPVAGTGEA